MLDGSQSIAMGLSAPPGTSGTRDVPTSWGYGPCLDIGLVNNMPDSAKRSTERQFSGLLAAGSDGGFQIRIHHLTISEVGTGGEVACGLRRGHLDAASLAKLDLDALIVTGTEPRAKSMRDEPYWKALTRLADWAEFNTISTIWSCLAAHAVVLHLDHVERRAIGTKRFGVFECETDLDHPLLYGLPPSISTPHSRYNELREEDLRRAGYRILTRSRQAGVDMFVKTRRNCLFVFFQGHPEYESATLLREYRRDIVRFLSGERERYPSAPLNYLDPESETQFMRFEARAKAKPSPELASEVSNTGRHASVLPCWRDSAVLVYRNWLNLLAETKRKRAWSGMPVLTR